MRLPDLRELIASLDEEHSGTDAEAAWATEIEDRARDVLAGTSVVVERGEMFQRIRAELNSSRPIGAQFWVRRRPKKRR